MGDPLMAAPLNIAIAVAASSGVEKMTKPSFPSLTVPAASKLVLISSWLTPAGTFPSQTVLCAFSFVTFLLPPLEPPPPQPLPPPLSKPPPQPPPHLPPPLSKPYGP